MQIIENGIQNALSISQEELRQVKQKSLKNIVPFVNTFNPNNMQVFNIIKSSVKFIKTNEVPGFGKELKMIQSRRQAPNLKKLLTKAEFKGGEPCVKVYGGKRCECCSHLLLSNAYKFKNVDVTFKIKTRFTCDSSNLIYVVICPNCKEEYIGETGINLTKLLDRVRIYRRHIRQPHYIYAHALEETLKYSRSYRYEVIVRH